jgi:hypothetical protein
MTTKIDSMAGVENQGTITKSRKIGNNTFEYSRNDGTRAIRLHNTDILTFSPDGTCTFNTGGWKTVTTKARMNDIGPVRIWTEKRVWYASNGNGETVVYQDGMTYHPERGIENAGQLPDKQLIKQIRNYARDFANALPLDLPDGGDCWGCYFTSESGDTSPMGHGHLLEHLKDNYFVPSLMWKVLESRGCDPSGSGCAWFWSAFVDSNGNTHPASDWQIKQYSKWIFEYIYARLIDGRE